MFNRSPYIAVWSPAHSMSISCPRIRLYDTTGKNIGFLQLRELDMTHYMLLLRGGDEGTHNYSPEQYQQLLQRYFEWSDRLRSAGQYLVAEQLKPGGRVVHATSAVVDGPFTETKETIGGYYLIAARNLDEATEIARECPVLTHGGMVEVRELTAHG